MKHSFSKKITREIWIKKHIVDLKEGIDIKKASMKDVIKDFQNPMLLSSKVRQTRKRKRWR